MELSADRDLVQRAQADPEAFGAIFDAYYARILKYCVHRSGDVELGRDLASLVFLRAMQQLWRYRWQGIPLSAWLYRIANNEIVSHFRKRRPISLDALLEEQGLEVGDSHDLRQEFLEAEQEMARHAQFLSVRAALETLPTYYQEAIALRFFEEKSILEIAQILGKREGTIKSLLSRGLAKLRQAMQPQEILGVVQIQAESSHSFDDV